jgi:hypothetical protein
MPVQFAPDRQREITNEREASRARYAAATAEIDSAILATRKTIVQSLDLMAEVDAMLARW